MPPDQEYFTPDHSQSQQLFCSSGCLPNRKIPSTLCSGSKDRDAGLPLSTPGNGGCQKRIASSMQATYAEGVTIKKVLLFLAFCLTSGDEARPLISESAGELQLKEILLASHAQTISSFKNPTQRSELLACKLTRSKHCSFRTFNFFWLKRAHRICWAPLQIQKDRKIAHSSFRSPSSKTFVIT